MTKSKKPGKAKSPAAAGYDAMLSGVAGLLEEARRNSVRAVNGIMTATYWEIGRRIVEYEQQGKLRAQYGAQLLERLSLDLNKRFGRGFSVINLRTMRRFYECWYDVQIRQTPSVEFRPQENKAKGQTLQTSSAKFSLRDIAACFPLPWSHYVRLMLFYHRRLRCLVVIDLKLDKFTHADAGQMHMYLNYAREHWTHQDENPPVGLILCAEKDHALARYALEGLPNKVLAAEYKTALPNEKSLVAEIDKTRKALESRRRGGDDDR